MKKKLLEANIGSGKTNGGVDNTEITDIDAERICKSRICSPPSISVSSESGGVAAAGVKEHD
ncbi:uncharacterized protein G2W53_019050 [Senna tora]|uniref:Uncharacterized protein n=1 Tax=Senna tora TaxID=362788 RepID=A0A834WQB8_9FABA|nr:uncharacterized protein G2W53_019050 [Senna tora]